MTVRIKLALFVLGVSGFLAQPNAAQPAEDGETASDQEKVKVVILVGGHGYDARGFDQLWSSFDHIDAEVWQGAPYTVFDDIGDFKYDVIVMYNLSSGITETQRENFLRLLDGGVGLVVWHHALANCQDWSEFERIAGAKFWMKAGERDGVQVARSGTGGGKVKMHIEDPQHPITKDMSDFEVQDETYNGQTFCEDIHVLVSTDHPRSDKPIAWVHNYRKARVFGYQSGHDAKVWTNESFQRLMARGIRWCGSE
jgi:type 1 glutamine amidotransferase